MQPIPDLNAFQPKSAILMNPAGTLGLGLFAFGTLFFDPEANLKMLQV